MRQPQYHWFVGGSGFYAQACNLFWSIGLDCPYHMECFDSGIEHDGKIPLGYFGVGSTLPIYGRGGTKGGRE